ncbi:hypothetical protein SAMN06269250_1216 [Spirosoma fluviale]|uniref:Uncharacterized protein n=1 Tax=Spirosoma fluviale TaxID=1597977 RepID=A0A286FAE1_9BACT|nr:hypothetical protein SAMN06269250_1216 [Spirosoma fluviale]
MVFIMTKSLVITLLVAGIFMPFSLLGYIDSFYLFPICLLLLLYLMVKEARNRK